MTPNYDISQDDHNITWVVLHEPHSLDDLIEVVADVADNYPNRLRLYDMRKFTFNLSSEDVQAISEFGKIKFKNPGRIALLVKDKLSFGIMRIFEAHRSQAGIARIRVFWEDAEAINWLRQEAKDMDATD
ncbi:MAG: hypothetical protein KJO69_10270 [Gammaproteobacteria bacterium]|nr:hypothetical protein [Gammaproteobacteria bacterium]NNJ72317.1 hypothetical protein [Enterobacterales bacterium]